MFHRFAFALAAPIVSLALVGFAVAACSNSTTTLSDLDGSAFGGDSSTSSPCGPSGVFGTFRISGTLDGTESLCGLNLGTFDGGSLTITQSDARSTT
jgi:hypothetical protein